jgi:hypothetical protein
MSGALGVLLGGVTSGKADSASSDECVTENRVVLRYAPQFFGVASIVLLADSVWLMASEDFIFALFLLVLAMLSAYLTLDSHCSIGD